MKQTGAIPIREACKLAFKQMGDHFYCSVFVKKVRSYTWNLNTMDGTILRKLRLIRAEDAQYNYRCIDNEKGLYEKISQ